MELGKLMSTSQTVDVYENNNVVTKLFKEGCDKTLALYEALTHARVEDTGLPIPKIHEVSVINNRWAINMDCISGKTLAEIIAEDGENIEKYIDQMLDVQLEIHSKKVPKISKLKDEIYEQINSLSCIDDTKKYELLTRLDSMPKHDKLCHGNFTPDNIIVNENGVYIVDWVAAKQGNASADVGKTYLLFALKSQDVAQMYLDKFCEKTNTSKKYVQDWLPIVAAARLTENIEEEKELLMKWLDVASYE